MYLATKEAVIFRLNMELSELQKLVTIDILPKRLVFFITDK